MNLTTHTLQVVKELHHIYPDIEGQLCSRHSTLFGKLRTTFNKLYDNMQPQCYVIVKGTCQFVEENFTDLNLSMALENGVIGLVTRTYPTSEIFVNSNHFGEELIFTHEGKLEEGLNNFHEQMQQIIRSATSNLSGNNLYGGIIYLHGNIPQNSFNYKESLLINFYLSVLAINNNLSGLTIEELICKMSQLQFLGSKQFIQRHFYGYKNRKFNLTLPDLQPKFDSSSKLDPLNPSDRINPKQCLIQKSQLLLDMNKQFKFLFCKLELAKEDVNYQIRRREEIVRRKQQLVEELRHQVGVESLFELFNKANQVDLNAVQFRSKFNKIRPAKSAQDLECQQELQEQLLNYPHKFLDILLQQMSLVSQFSNQNLTLQQLISALWQINSQYLKIHSQQVTQLVEQMKERLDIKGCMVVNQNFLMIVVAKNKFAELLCQVKQKMTKGQFKSKSLFKIQEEELILHRWGSDNAIGEKMFSSVPSQGIGLFDPSEAIWFD